MPSLHVTLAPEYEGQHFTYFDVKFGKKEVIAAMSNAGPHHDFLWNDTPVKVESIFPGNRPEIQVAGKWMTLRYKIAHVSKR